MFNELCTDTREWPNYLYKYICAHQWKTMNQIQIQIQIKQENMHYTIDLRLAAPALVNFLLNLLLNSGGGLWDWQFHPLIKMSSLILGFLLIYLMLSSLKLPLSLMLSLPNHQRLGFGNSTGFSLPLALTLLASFLFPPPPFYYAYLFCAAMFAPCWSALLDFFFPVVVARTMDAEETLESVVAAASLVERDDGMEIVIN